MKLKPVVILVILLGLTVALLFTLGSAIQNNRLKKIAGQILTNDKQSQYELVRTKWPIPKIANSSSYLMRCVTSRGNFHYGEVSLGSNLILKAWADCFYRDVNNEISFVTIPLYVQNLVTRDVFFTFSIEPSQTQAMGFSPEAIKKIFSTNKIFSDIDMSKAVTVTVIFGGPDSRENGFFDMFTEYARENGIEKLDSFVKTGKAEDLENLEGVGRYLPAYKVNLDIIR